MAYLANTDRIPPLLQFTGSNDLEQLKRDSKDPSGKFCEYTKSHQVVPFERVKFMVCALYLAKAHKKWIRVISKSIE